MKVVATKGMKCPREENPRKYITDSEPAEVPDSGYYRRLVADGSLIVASANGAVGTKPKGGK